MFFAPLFLALASDLTPPPAGSFGAGPARPNAYMALNKGRMTLITDQGLENVSKLVGDAPLEHRGHLTVSALGEVELRWMNRGSMKIMGAASVEWSGSPFDGLPLGLFDFTRAQVEVRTGELGIRLPGGVLLVADRAALELVQRSSGVFGVHHLGGKPARLVIPAHGAPDVRTLETGAWIWIDPADYLGRSRFEYVLGVAAEADAPSPEVEPKETNTDAAAEPEASAGAPDELAAPVNQASLSTSSAPQAATEEPTAQAPTIWISTPIGMVEVESAPVAPEPEAAPTELPTSATPALPLDPANTVNEFNDSPAALDGHVLPVESPATQTKWTPWMPELEWVPTPSALELLGGFQKEIQATDPTQTQANARAVEETLPLEMPDAPEIAANDSPVDALPFDEAQAPPLEPAVALESKQASELETTSETSQADVAIDEHLEQATQRLSNRWLEDLSSRWQQPSAPHSRQPIGVVEWPASLISAPYLADPIPLPNDVWPFQPPKVRTKPALQPKTYEPSTLVKQPSLSDLLNGRAVIE